MLSIYCPNRRGSYFREPLPMFKSANEDLAKNWKFQICPSLQKYKPKYDSQITFTQNWEYFSPHLEATHSIVEYSIHLEFLSPSRHSFLTILGFYGGCMGHRTTKSAIILFLWVRILGPGLHLLHEVSSKPLWKVHKKQFPIVGGSKKRIVFAKFVQFSIGSCANCATSHPRQSSVNVSLAFDAFSDFHHYVHIQNIRPWNTFILM